MISYRSLRAAVAVVPLLIQSALVTSASAEDYPDHRITFVVPYPAGGAADAIGRLLAIKLSEAWKQPVVVENKSGAGGIVGNDYVAKALVTGIRLIGISSSCRHPMSAPSFHMTVSMTSHRSLRQCL